MYVPYFEAAGSHRQIGEMIGRAFSGQIRQFLEFKREYFENGAARLDDSVRKTKKKFIDCCHAFAPHLLDEMQGCADGAGVGFDELLLINCADEARNLCRAQSGDGCTSFALLPETTGGPILAGQSKDGPGPQWDHYIVLLIRPDDRPAVLQLCYPGMLALLGISETGMCVFSNNISDGVVAEGLPTMVLKRLAWDCQRVDEVESMVASHGVAIASNFLFCDCYGGAACLETRGARYGRVDAHDGVLVHTNHYLTRSLRGRESDAYIRNYRSRERVERLKHLYGLHLGAIDVPKVFECYRDHDGHPKSICCHETPEEFYGTTATLIAEPTSRRLHVCVGHCCEHQPVVYQV